ncbi:unnamed protein product [Prorocentrum cordatum]|uniref:Uncharacterized protein n=1 Tax=Prorocentrum cordatum TaxID=2364126 RepID=A0ABN9U620_9DINO|nr:unnamed protein product [Polarella glacialis]
MSAAAQASLRAATWLADRVLESAVVSEAGSCAIAVQVFGGVRVAFGTVLIGGVLVGVQWRAGGSWQARVVAGFATAAELTTATGTAPPAGAEESGEIFYMITPDGDMHPHALHTDVIQGAARALPGQRGRASVVGTAPAANARRPAAPKEAGLDSDSAPIPPGWESLPSLSVDFGAIGEGLGFVKVGNSSFLVQYGGPETALDARALAIHESAGDGRRLGFREGAKQLTETAWPPWPLLGPRTAGWVRRFIRDQDAAPRSRRARFKAEAGLPPSDPGVDFHEFCLRLLQIGIQIDQLNASELAIFELICRKAQMIEYKHRGRYLHRMGAAGDDLAEDEHIYLGTSETRGPMMISPALSSYAADELHKEASSRADKLASENKFLKEKLAAIDPKKANQERLRPRMKSGNQLRMILDTRAVNQEFIDPDTTALPSAGVWRGLKIPASHNLSLSPVDIEAAFYRIGVPPGLDEMFVLPAVPVDALLEALPEVDIGSRVEGKVSPLLTVLPMGWSWSSYFCQAPVVSQVVAAGTSASRIIQDRCAVPDVSETAGVAVHVDGVAAIGCDPASVSATIEQVHQRLEASHLKCKGVHSDPWDQKFTGLNFDFETGRISVSRGRVWRLRLALLEVAERGYCSGDDMLSLLGHYTWAAILRRCLLSVFHSAYRFARAAGPRRWRLWPEVATECRAAAALIAFAYLDTKLEVDPVVLATDASTGSGDLEATGFGRYAVTEKTWTQHDVWAAASCVERWRYKCLVEDPETSDTVLPFESEGSIRTSSAAKPARRASTSVEHQVNFEEIGPSFLLPLDSWKLKVFGRWRRPEDIMRLEGRAFITGVGHRLRRAGDCRNAGQLGADEARGRAASALARACGEAATWRDAGGTRFLGEAEEREQPGRDFAAKSAAQPSGDQEDPLGDANGVEHRLSLSSDSSSSSDTESSGSACDSSRDLEKTAGEYQLAANYMDVLFFDGMEVGEGSRLLAALQYRRPSLGTARHGNFPVARAAVAGFRRRARGGTRDPLCWPWALAVVGVSLLLEDLEFATALWLAWDGMLRLPSDLVSMTPKTLIGTGRAVKPTWALLLYSSEEEARSKVMGADEGVILREACWSGGGSAALRRPRGARGPSCQPRSFDGAWFTKRFEERLAALPEAPTAVAYQVRHGAASHAAAVDQLPLSGITERLRHGNPHSSLRYAKHVRYLSLLNRAPQAVVDWSETIHARLGSLLGGSDVLQAPAFLPQSALGALRASCAKASNSGANKRVKFSPKLDSRKVKRADTFVSPVSTVHCGTRSLTSGSWTSAWPKHLTTSQTTMPMLKYYDTLTLNYWTLSFNNNILTNTEGQHRQDYDTRTLNDWTLNVNFNIFTNTEGQYVRDWTLSYISMNTEGQHMKDYDTLTPNYWTLDHYLHTQLAKDYWTLSVNSNFSTDIEGQHMQEYDTLTLDDWTMNFNFNVFTNTEGQYVQEYTTLHLNRHQWNNCTLVDAITQEYESYEHIMDPLRKSGPPEDKKCLQGIGSPAPPRALTALEGLYKCDAGGSMKGAIEDIEAETEISKEDILDAINFVRLEKCYDHDKTKLVIGALGAPMWEGQILISRALEAEGQAVHHRDVGPVGWLEALVAWSATSTAPPACPPCACECASSYRLSYPDVAGASFVHLVRSWCSHVVTFLLGVLIGSFALPALLSCKSLQRGKLSMPRAGDAHAIRYRVGGPQVFHERITLFDAPPSQAVIVTVDGDVYLETAVVNADCEEVRPLRGLGAPVYGVAEANVSRFRGAASAAELSGHLRDGALLLGAALPPSPFTLAGGAGAGAAWVPQALALDDPVGAAVVAPAVAAGAVDGVGGAAAAGALAAAAPPVAADCRAFPAALDLLGRRQLDFATAARDSTTTSRDDWPIKGPRTTQWCLDHMRRNAGGPLAWHSKWKAEARLRDSDAICQQHELNCRPLETATCYDQFNTAELAAFELARRQTQLIEERHYEDTASAQVAAEEEKDKKKGFGASESLLASEAEHYTGVAASKGNLCISPAVTEFTAEQLKAEAAAAKEGRKAREDLAPWPDTSTAPAEVAELADQAGDLVPRSRLDNFAAVGCDAATVTAKRDRIIRTLERRGLPVHSIDQASPTTISTGLEVEGGRGTVRVKPSSLIRLRQAILAALRRGAASPRLLEASLGHIIWAMICKRETLSILSSAYVLKSLKDSDVRPLWNSVRFERWCVASTLPLWPSDLGLPWGSRASAPDASPIGVGVCTREPEGPPVSRTGRSTERWRRRCTSVVAAGANALGLDGPRAEEGFLGAAGVNGCKPINPEVSVKGFLEIPGEITKASERATVISRRHWDPCKNILELEGEALRDAARHASRNVAALALAINFCRYLRWLPSELNALQPAERQRSMTIQAARRMAHPRPAQLAGGSINFLEMPAVTDATRERYRGHAARPLEWVTRHGLDFSSSSQLGAAAAAFLTDLALDGFDSATGRVSAAALRHFLPHLLGGKRPLPRTARALDGWRRLVPPQMRPPLPRAAATAVAGWMISRNLPGMVVFVALVFHAYPRPSEAHRPRAGSLVAPIAGTGFSSWGLIVNDAKSGRPGKTGVTDESAPVDAPGLWPALLAFSANRDANGLLELGLQKELP